MEKPIVKQLDELQRSVQSLLSFLSTVPARKSAAHQAYDRADAVATAENQLRKHVEDLIEHQKLAAELKAAQVPIELHAI